MERNKIYCGDSSEILKTLDSNTIDLVVTSPPYDTLRKYNGAGDSWNHEKFKSIANELYRVMKDGGVLVWNVFDKTEKGSKTGTSLRQCLYFQEIGFNINDYMIWCKTNPMPQVKQPRYTQCFEFMFILSKGMPRVFNPIMRACKCGGQVYDSTCKNIGGESGRTHKTFNVNKEMVDYNIWNIAVAQNKTGHPAVFPYDLAYRHILSWSNEGDVVLDPFMGSGTTALACINTNRDYIGIEMNEEYCDIIKKRIENLAV